MKWEYYYENHDWDMTLGAARELLSAGIKVEQEQGEGHFLPYFSGSMLLSFCAFESFVNSLAFLIHSSGRPNFNYAKYGRLNGIWARLERVAEAIDLNMDKSRQPFSTLEMMRGWRNEMVHSKPFSTEPIFIDDPSEAPATSVTRSYLADVTRHQARTFYRAAIVGIASLQRASGFDPITFVTYRDLRSGETIKIQRRTVQLRAKRGPAS